MLTVCRLVGHDSTNEKIVKVINRIESELWLIRTPCGKLLTGFCIHGLASQDEECNE